MDVLSVHDVTIITCGEPNYNGRVYPKTLLKRAISTKSIKARLAMGSLFGCFNPSESLSNKADPDVRYVSHTVNRLWFDGDDLKATVLVLNTSSGRKLDKAFKEGNVHAWLSGSGIVEPSGLITSYTLWTIHCECANKGAIYEEVN